MSRNFELMQQAGHVLGPGGSTTNSPASPSVQSVYLPAVIGESDQRGPRLDIDQLTHEECLRLIQRLFSSQTQNAPRLVVFAAIEKGSGCSQICAQVAQILPNNVRGSVCLVEANFRSPSLPGLFKTTNHFGLTDALQREGPIRSFAKPLHTENLWLLSSGSLTADSSSLLNSNRVKARFEELRNDFDYTIVDAPPLSRYADAVALGQLADGLVLILEANSTRREVAQSIAANLQAAKVRVLGAVLNKRTFPIPEVLYRRF
jgi:capsular exopolysaccharide synthesis family protein